METFWNVTLQLLNGFSTSVILFVLTLLISLPLGLLMSLCTMSKLTPLRFISKIVVWVLRGTPLMLQIIVIFFVPGLLFGFVWPSMHTGWVWFDKTISTRFLAAMIAFGINYAAYFSEIYRAGIQAIPAGQTEAGFVLGMSKTQIFFKVILVQAFKRIIPPMSNEIITLIKDTSLANVISVTELIFAANLLLKKYIWALFYAGAFYLIFNGVMTLLLGKLEKKFEYFKV